ITATAPGKVESNSISVKVAAALAPTTLPEVEGTVRAGDKIISGITDADALVCVNRDETVIGKATADGTGAYTVTLKDGVTLLKDDRLAIVAKAPDKSISEAVSVTVDAELVEIIEPIETEVISEAADPEATTEVVEADTTTEPTETEVISEAADPEVTTEVVEADTTTEPTETEVISEAADPEATTEVVGAETTTAPTETEVIAEATEPEATTEVVQAEVTTEL
ncbi:hypothetical protein, partial [Desulfosporosinus sp.]|uniref:hypothetical protein n=1 Tax=Desulfosporosinus sp. TaxID=157907 RepID=UPI00345C3F22|nr:hypothetical protein [Desulfosporosinus sp.]